MRLALVDYGQVKVLNDDERLRAARLIVGLDRARAEKPEERAAVAALFRCLGGSTARNDPDVGFESAFLLLFYTRAHTHPRIYGS